MWINIKLDRIAPLVADPPHSNSNSTICPNPPICNQQLYIAATFEQIMCMIQNFSAQNSRL